MNEQERTDAIETACGGAYRAEHLQSIWNNTIGRKDRDAAFKAEAKREGYSERAISLFLTAD